MCIRDRVDFFQELLVKDTPPNEAALTKAERRQATQLHYLLWGVRTASSLAEGWNRLWSAGPVLGELRSALHLLKNGLDTPVGGNAFGIDIPLKLHASYSRDEILAAFDVGSPEKPPSVREGVKWVEQHNTDLFFITLNKSEKDFSPSTICLLYTSPSPRDRTRSRMPSSA